MPAVSAHIIVGPDDDCHQARLRAAHLLAERFGIEHSTLQVEHRPRRGRAAADRFSLTGRPAPSADRAGRRQHEHQDPEGDPVGDEDVEACGRPGSAAARRSPRSPRRRRPGSRSIGRADRGAVLAADLAAARRARSGPRPGPRAGTSSGRRRRGRSRVNRPAEIVAPERETPGISARAWAKPMNQPVAHVQLLDRALPSSRRARPAASRTRTGSAPIRSGRDRARPTRSGPAKTKPKIEIGIVPRRMNQPRFASWLRSRKGTRSSRIHARAISHQVAPEVEQHRRHRPELDHGREPGAGVLPAEQRRHDPQVAAGGDRQELGQPLDEAEDDGLERAHGRAG